MHVSCISMEEYARRREACRLPPTSLFPLYVLLLSVLLPRLSRRDPSEVYLSSYLYKLFLHVKAKGDATGSVR